MRTLTALVVSVIAAGGIAVGTAAPASAGCQGGFTPWGGGTTCDGALSSDGTFQRCVTSSALGFGGTNCFLLNINEMANQVPYVGP